MVYLEISKPSAVLAAPAISLQYLVAQPAVGLGIKTGMVLNRHSSRNLSGSLRQSSLLELTVISSEATTPEIPALFFRSVVNE